MQHQVLLNYMIALTVLKVQCNDVNLFFKDQWSYVGCMELCRKFGRRSPSVRTLQDWRKMERIVEDLEGSTPLPEIFYLSVTRGEMKGDFELMGIPDTLTLEHWPHDIRQTEEAIWRDYYTGEKLENFNQTWDSSGESHCAALTKGNLVGMPDSKSVWLKAPCSWNPGLDPWCVCQQNDQKKKLILRGTCTSSHLRGVGADIYFKPQQLPSSLDKLYYTSEIGWASSRGGTVRDGDYNIDYNVTSSQWIHSGKDFKTTAFSLARNDTYLLGKYNWTVSNDHQECHLEKGKASNESYSIELKLSGCNQGFTFDFYTGKMVLDAGAPDDAEFTCNDGHCVRMENRCDQWPDCDDGSDEEGCKLFSLAKGYNKVVPPYTKVNSRNKTIVPVSIDVSINLLKMMGIDERENTIDLQFEITLEWKDHRITYSNLKTDVSLNALTDAQKDIIWLPIVIYANTDQKETTRLGWIEEWSTSVEVFKDANFTR